MECEDDGVGISAENKKNLLTQGYGKITGFGLFLSREIPAIIGITITENGVPGKGAWFEIAVPNGGWRFTGTGEKSRLRGSIRRQTLNMLETASIFRGCAR